MRRTPNFRSLCRGIHSNFYRMLNEFHTFLLRGKSSVCFKRIGMDEEKFNLALWRWWVENRFTKYKPAVLNFIALGNEIL